MAQELVVFQSLWAMERRHSDGMERSLEQNVKMILDAGFDGVSIECKRCSCGAAHSGLAQASWQVDGGAVFPKVRR
jgi:hypothetical protein